MFKIRLLVADSCGMNAPYRIRDQDADDRQKLEEVLQRFRTEFAMWMDGDPHLSQVPSRVCSLVDESQGQE